MTQLQLDWRIGDHFLRREQIPLLMGILNVTPDSFSDGGRFVAVEAAVEQAEKLIADGATIIDIGGESTRPGAAPVDVAEELQRTIPVVTELARRTDTPISIDTTKAEVARQALQAGAVVVNDISGMTFDEDMPHVCAEHAASICLMHIRGTPQTMQDDPTYDDVVADVTEFLARRLEACATAGIEFDRICLDPGIGFGKTAEHNLQLMQHLDVMRAALGRPLLVGHSRKRFLSRLLGRPVEERTAGTVGVSIALSENGADLLRVHDVAACRDALIAWQAVRL